MNKKRLILIISCIIVVALTIASIFYYQQQQKEERLEQEKEDKIEEIKSHYNQYIKTTKETEIYIEKNGNYEASGVLSSNLELELEDIEINEDTLYFKIKDFNQKYYIQYRVVEPIEKKSEPEKINNSYIPFNQNIITEAITNFYQDGKLKYSFNQSFEFPIIIKEIDRYYIEFNNELLEILKKDVKSTKTNQNSNKKIAKQIPTVAYHFFYNPEKGETCNQEICHTKKQFESHLNYLKENEYYTASVEELEKFIDGKIQLPEKTVVITIDDGHMMDLGIDLLEKYNMKGTVFLITSAYSPKIGVSKNIAFHSHSNKLHTQGDCPTGQGGGIQCLDKSILLDDLKKSREKLNGSTAFCYPFYEYNNYSISVLKEAGFTIAFAGSWANGIPKAKVGSDKMQIPRFTMINSSDVSYFASVIKPS